MVVGELPPQLAALNRSNMAVQEMAVRAVLEGSREAAKYAVMLDPLTSAVLSLAEIDAMFDEMWAAQGEQLSLYS
jgi:alpha-galactosidase